MNGLRGVLLGTGLVAAALGVQGQEARPEAWKEAIQGQRQYCMAEVCMGMSLKEVTAIPGTTFKPFPSNKWARNCDGDFRNWEMGEFFAKDGTRYSVGFRDFPGDEPKEDRFRVQSVALTQPLEWNDFRLLTIKIASRYGMRAPKGGGDFSDQEWTKQGEGFTLKLNSMFSAPPKTSLISMSILSPQYPEWMSTQPLCARPKKPLPNV